MKVTISQREARRLKRRVYELEREEDQRRNAWTQEWPHGVHIGETKFTADSGLIGAIRTARKLKHAVVVSCDENGLVRFHALSLTAP
jgi:hypothetical protein